jgi:tRNA G18 (ribose-2'-O)-methylase SpoU
MVSREMRKRVKLERINMLKRFERHRRKNLFATPGIHRYIVILDGLKPSFNVGKIFRSAEAFGAHEVHLVGLDFFDPAPAKGAFKWVPARFHKTFDDCYKDLFAREYKLFTLEPEDGRSLLGTPLPEKSAFILGHEEFGISFDKKDYPDIGAIQIPQFGKSQSLNVSVAASIVMYEYVRQHGAAVLKDERPMSNVQRSTSN